MGSLCDEKAPDPFLLKGQPRGLSDRRFFARRVP